MVYNKWKNKIPNRKIKNANTGRKTYKKQIIQYHGLHVVLSKGTWVMSPRVQNETNQ